MANGEGEQTTDTRDLSKLVESAKSAQVHLNGINELLEQMQQQIKETGNVSPELEKLFGSIQKRVQRTRQDTDNIIGSKSIKDIGNISSSFGIMTEGIKKEGKEIAESFMTNNKITTDSIKTMFASAGPLLAQAGIVTGLQILDKKLGGVFSKMQQPLLDMNKRAEQMGLALGESFTSSAGYADKFRESLTATAVDTNVLQEDITKVTNALGAAFIPKEATGNLDGLSDSIKNVDGSLNLVKTSILVGAATGMDYAKVAEMMSKAHLELGETVEGSATILGSIAIAADKSGLTFGKVSDSVMKAADSLKMWGGTVGAVTPVYSAFARALGEGRKGLAPELFEQYISGLQGMQFEMKALIGMQAGGGGKGAIGAGLEMEALMEKGPEGMAEMSDKLIDAIKQFSGGEMITREEAIADPALERNFIMQRQLLKQMVGGSDASATQMMGILKDIDKSGMAIGEDQKKALGDMMGKGERVQDRATGMLNKSIIELQQTTLNAAANIIGELGPLISVHFQKQIGATRRFMEQMAKAGKVELPQIDQLIESFTGKKGISDIMSLVGLDEEERGEAEEGVERGQESAKEVMNELKTEIAQIRKTADAKGEAVNQDDIEKAFNKAADTLSKQKGEIGEVGQEGGLDKSQRAERETLEQAELALRGAYKQMTSKPPVLDEMMGAGKKTPKEPMIIEGLTIYLDPESVDKEPEVLARETAAQRTRREPEQAARETAAQRIRKEPEIRARETAALESSHPSTESLAKEAITAQPKSREAETETKTKQADATIYAKLSEDSRSIQLSIEPFMKNVREAAREEAIGVIRPKQ